jgi:hypothetical protein
VIFAAAVSPLNNDFGFDTDEFEHVVEERMGATNSSGRFVARV